MIAPVNLLQLLNPLAAGEAAPFILLVALLLLLVVRAASAACARYDRLLAEVDEKGAYEEDGVLREHRTLDATGLEFRLMTGDDRLVEVAPSVLLALGMLGTFVGIAMTIYSASSLLGGARLADTSQIQEYLRQMSSTLTSMGVKFQSSVWGIAAHLCARFYRDFRVARMRRALVTRILGLAEERNLEREQTVATAVRECARLLQVNLPLLEKLDAGAQGLGGGATQLAASLEHMASAAAKVDSTSASLERAAKSVARLVERTEETHELLKAIEKGGHDDREALLDALQKLSSSHEEVLRGAVTELSTQVGGAVTRSAEATRGAIVESASSISASLRDALARATEVRAAVFSTAPRQTEFLQLGVSQPGVVLSSSGNVPGALPGGLRSGTWPWKSAAPLAPPPTSPFKKSKT